MSDDLMDMFDELDGHTTISKTRDSIIRAPFPYPGGKSRSVKEILKYLPHSGVYVEPFGGSGAVLLAKSPAKLDVFNDRYSGVVSFYRCIRNEAKMNKLVELLDLTIHSREDFIWCKETWENCEDDVERAARWFYMINYSFGSLCRNWGRTTSGRGRLSGKVQNKIKGFSIIHERFKTVQVDNQDWYDCLKDYDSPETVFYIDPPYIDADPGIYKNKMSHGDHNRLLETIFSLEGFCAVSGYNNPFYMNRAWDDVHMWDVFVSIKSAAYTDTNYKKKLEGIEERGHTEECLWIKEAR